MFVAGSGGPQFPLRGSVSIVSNDFAFGREPVVNMPSFNAEPCHQHQ